VVRASRVRDDGRGRNCSNLISSVVLWDECNNKMASLNNNDRPNDNSNLNMSPATVQQQQQQQQQQRCRKLAIPIYSRYAAALVSPVHSFAYRPTGPF
jgi:hypothetical protein